MSNYEDEESKPFKFEVKMDYRGNITINLIEYLDQLSDEEKKELLEDGGWWPFVQKEMAESIINSFGTECYNENYHVLRTMLLNSEAMPDVISRWAKDMIELRYKSKQYEEYWRTAYYDLTHWLRQLDDDKYWRIPKLPDHKWGVEYPKEIVEDAYQKAKEWGLLFSEKEGENKDE